MAQLARSQTAASSAWLVAGGASGIVGASVGALAGLTSVGIVAAIIVGVVQQTLP